MPAPSAKPRSFARTLRRWRRITAALRPFAMRHWGLLLKGSLAALVMIGAKLALPWPVRAVLKPYLKAADPSSHHGHELAFPVHLPSGLDPALAMGGVFFLLLLVLGLADFLERVYYARFSIAMSRDLRVAAFRGAVQSGLASTSSASGDVVARLIGDMARFKSGLKSFLVHVAPNGAMFIGVTAVLMWMDMALGLVFAAAGLVTAVVTLASARSIFENSRKFRKKEGKRASRIQDAIRSGPSESRFAGVKSSKGFHKAKVTHIQGLATWFTHGVFGVAVLLSFWIGGNSVVAGRLQVDHIVVFMMYALMMRGPIVRLTRQGARTGKILAGADRLVAMVKDSGRGGHVKPGNIKHNLQPLQDRIQLAQVVVRGVKAHGKRPRLGPIDLDIRAGEKIALLGSPGAGKTTLLQVLSGRRSPRKGAMVWDNLGVTDSIRTTLWRQVAFVPQHPSWVRRSLRDLLELPATSTGEDAMADLISRCGIDEILSRLPLGLDSRLSSDDLSPGECKQIGMARGLVQSASVRLLDDPFAGMSDSAARQLLQLVLSASPEALIVVSMSRPVDLSQFGRVIELESGEIVFDGRAGDWLASMQRSAKSAADRGDVRSDISDRSNP